MQIVKWWLCDTPQTCLINCNSVAVVFFSCRAAVVHLKVTSEFWTGLLVQKSPSKNIHLSLCLHCFPLVYTPLLHQANISRATKRASNLGAIQPKSFNPDACSDEINKDLQGSICLQVYIRMEQSRENFTH